MILKKLKVKNFRLLKDFELELKDKESLIIGKNNTGKTSVLLILDKMLNSYKLCWEDINLEWQKSLYSIVCDYDINIQNDSQLCEAINLQLYIEYTDNDSFANIQKFMMDLDPDNNTIVLEFVLFIPIEKLKILQQIIVDKDINNFQRFSKYISKNFSNFFVLEKYSRGFDSTLEKVTDELSSAIDNKDIQKVIKISGIRADRSVSNDDRNHALSTLTEKYYNSYKNSKNKGEFVFEKLEQAVMNADEALFEVYNGKKDGKESTQGIFTDLIQTVKNYGGIEGNIDIMIESSISEKNLLTDNTSLSYRQGNEYRLPETYNGLGYLNLIGILLEIETKIQEIYDQPADINILYIEEPEAHTHPQLQYIFIHHIKEHIEKHREELQKNKKKYLQLLITSHSSHIVSQCDFNDIIYLKKNANSISARCFNYLEEEYLNSNIEGFKFVKQYLTLNRSELFFADKVICIEGDTERILLPMMMYKTDKKFLNINNYTSLLSQNISIIEVGAYSHIFMPLFKFLGIKVLIITDLDSGIRARNKNGGFTQPKKSRTNEGNCTTNQSILNFFGKNDLELSDNQLQLILDKSYEDKVKDNIRIAYQIPEKIGEYQARSFEDAFIELNWEFIFSNQEKFLKYGALKSKINKKDPYTISENKIEKKTTFASSFLYFDDTEKITWKVPKYIEEGLLWIQEN